MLETIDWDNPAMSPLGIHREPAPVKNAHADATVVPTGIINTEEVPAIETADHAIATAMGAAATTNAASAKQVADIEASSMANVTIIKAMESTVVTALFENRRKILQIR